MTLDEYFSHPHNTGAVARIDSDAVRFYPDGEDSCDQIPWEADFYAMQCDPKSVWFDPHAKPPEDFTPAPVQMDLFSHG